MALFIAETRIRLLKRGQFGGKNAKLEFAFFFEIVYLIVTGRNKRKCGGNQMLKPELFSKDGNNLYDTAESAMFVETNETILF